ncbi:MAG: hypothetical protein ACXW4Q_04730, partial [Anaerolineales bacterium]
MQKSDLKGNVSTLKDSTKSKSIYRMPGKLWKLLKKHLPKEPKEECPFPGEKSFPARRWVVERTFGWLAKRRSIATRWCK